MLAQPTDADAGANSGYAPAGPAAAAAFGQKMRSLRTVCDISDSRMAIYRC
jgi:hypothetical protein